MLWPGLCYISKSKGGNITVTTLNKSPSHRSLFAKRAAPLFEVVAAGADEVEAELPTALVAPAV